MSIEITTRFSFSTVGPADVLLQFEAADIPEQRVVEAESTLPPADHVARVPAQDGIGERIWLHAEGHYQIAYRARVSVRRLLVDVATLDQLDTHDLPGEAVQYLFDSHYCPASHFQHFVTTALDSFVERRGICRDYAHLMVALARASAIPARYVSVYAPGVEPQDFHAVAELFLADHTIPGGGAWHMIDATGMADPAQTVKIGVGRDAADVSFMTSFGDVTFGEKEVSVRAVS